MKEKLFLVNLSHAVVVEPARALLLALAGALLAPRAARGKSPSPGGSPPGPPPSPPARRPASPAGWGRARLWGETPNRRAPREARTGARSQSPRAPAPRAGRAPSPSPQVPVPARSGDVGLRAWKPPARSPTVPPRGASRSPPLWGVICQAVPLCLDSYTCRRGDACVWGGILPLSLSESPLPGANPP